MISSSPAALDVDRRMVSASDGRIGLSRRVFSSCCGVGLGCRMVSGSGGRIGLSRWVTSSCCGAGCGTATGAGASLMPMRAYSHRRGAGAHQLSSPATRRNAGTTTPRITVASMTIASAVPMPNIFIKDSPLAKDNSVMVSSSAALLMIRPTLPSPITMASLFDSPESRASFIRLSRKIS